MIACCFAPFVALAQDAEEADDDSPAAWAMAIAEGVTPRWVGPRVLLSAPAPRPASTGLVVRSMLRPLAVHGAEGIDEARLERAREALELAHAWMAERGWGEPYPDGGRGGGDELDLYLHDAPLADSLPGSFDRTEAAPGEADDVPPRAVRVSWDAPISWAPLDAVTSFVELDGSGLDDDALASCVIDAYAQAIAAQQDPAEAPAWRRAIGAFVAWQITGSFGCASDAIEQQQQHPERGLVTHAPGSGEAGAMLLGALSARHDGGSGDFVRDLTQAARQWTWEGEGLRAEPDLWHAITHFLSLSRQSVQRLVEEVAIGRYFTASRAGQGAPALPMMRDVPGEVPIAATVEWARLPRTPLRGELELEPGGSAYVLADVRDAPDDGQLRVWLRGEFGVRWSMVAVRLDDRGRELGRMRTPVRREPRAFLPVELDDEVAKVLIVVTNVSWRRPDADETDDNVRGFRLVLDRAGE